MSPPRNKLKKVAVVVIGDEILAGDVEESNAFFLARELSRIGSSVAIILILPDEEFLIAEEITSLADKFDAVLVTGGIGVTHDDVTKAAVSRATMKPLGIHQEALSALEAHYGEKMNLWRRRLAEFPMPCRLIPNPLAPAPGFVVGNIYVFPGIPRMLREMFPNVAGEFAGPTSHEKTIYTHLSESIIAGPLGKISRENPEVKIGSYPISRNGKNMVRLVLKSLDSGKLAEVALKTEEMLAGLDSDS